MINSVNVTGGALSDPKASDLDKLKAVAKQFESVFARQMFKSMREAKLNDEDLFGSDATDQFREMQDSNLADQFSAKGALGLGDLLVKQFQARLSKAPVTPADSAGTSNGAATPAALAMPVRPAG